VINSGFPHDTEFQMITVRHFALAASLIVSSAAAHAQPGITAISFTGTAMSATGSWASIPSPGFWNIGAILTDSAHHPIGSLSPLTTLNTAGAASYPTGFRVTLGDVTHADVIVVVYRSTTSFVAGDTVDKAEYTGLCPAGCVAGDLIVPVSGELLNSDFTPGASAMPVKLQDFSVD
jgi:hypothetical protein